MPKKNVNNKIIMLAGSKIKEQLQNPFLQHLLRKT